MKHKFKQKFLSLLLTMTVLVGSMAALPQLAFSAAATAILDTSWYDNNPTPSGNTTGNTFTIDSSGGLEGLAMLVNSGDLFTPNGQPFDFSGDTIVLDGSDIDLSDVDWTPIGNSSHSFDGTFDGNGWAVENLTINSSSGFQGLFGEIGSGGTIQNLSVTDCNIGGAFFVGGVVGFNNNGIVQNCYSTGTVSGSSNYIGGVTGVNGGTVQNCYSSCSVTGDNSSDVGGVVGQNYATVKNCYSTGTSVGGSGSNYVGGVVGDNGSGTVTNCIALNQSITNNGGSYIGRITGNGGTLSGNYAWSGMEVNSATKTGSATDLNGADASANDLINDNDSIWNTITGTGESSGWTYTTGGVPVLTYAGGSQDSTMPSYITDSAGSGGFTLDPNTGAYEIGNATDLEALAAEVNGANGGSGGFTEAGKTFELTNDIDLDGETFTPIGNDGNPFEGTFNGNGFAVEYLVINSNDNSADQGLFGMVEGGTVENLAVTNCQISGAKNVGGIVANVFQGTITNCYTTGTFAGTGSNSEVGGVAGVVNYSTISNCYSTVTVTGAEVGGVAGYVNGMEGYPSTVTNCAALDQSVSGSDGKTGRVVGENNGGTLSGNFAWSGMTVNNISTGLTTGDTTINGADANLDDLNTAGTWGSFTSQNGWSYSCSSNELPILTNALANVDDAQDSTMPSYITGSDDSGGSGGDFDSFTYDSDNSAYEINNSSDLAELATLVNSGISTDGVTFELTGDISLPTGSSWTPIGTSSYLFDGTFNGNGYAVENLNINNTSSSAGPQGLFGGVGSDGLIKNLGVTGCNVNGSTATGGVAGMIDGIIQNCYVTGSVIGTRMIGGVAGALGEGGRVINSYSTGSVSGTSMVGGVAGEIAGSIENSYSTGSVSGTSGVGGITGDVDGGSIENCYVTGTISGTGASSNEIGGVAGFVNGGTVQNCIALSQSVTSSGSNIGRIAGSVNSDVTNNLSGNFAWSGMTVNNISTGLTTGDTTINGADANLDELNTDSTWSGFISQNGWSYSGTANAIPTLTNVGGTQVSFLPSYIVPQSQTPTVTGISPNSGSTAGGTSVTVTGTGFTGATAVNFGTTAGRSIIINSDTSITITSPVGTGTVDVTVIGAGGTSETSSSDAFTYVAPTQGGTGTGTPPPAPVDVTISGSSDSGSGSSGGSIPTSSAQIPASDTNTSTINNVTVNLPTVTVTAPASVLNSALGGDDTSWLKLSQAPPATDTQTAVTAAEASSSVTPVSTLDVDLTRYYSNGTSEPVHQLSGNVTVSITLTPAQIALINNSSNAQLLYYNPNTGALTNMNAVFDLTAGTATFQTNHFSTFVVATEAAVGVTYKEHVQNIGWQGYVNDGAEAGTTGKSLRGEAVQISLTGDIPAGASITYQAHVQNIGWQKAVSNGATAGTTGKSLRLEALKITLSGMLGYEVQYRAHVQGIGWMPWQITVNGTNITSAAVAGTTGKSLRLEAIEIRIVKISS